MCWLLLAFIQCNSVIRLQSAAARTHLLADGGATARGRTPPTGKRDPGDRAVRARAAALRSVSAAGVSLSRSSFILWMW